MVHEKELNKLNDLIVWMATQANGLSLPNDHRVSIAIRCFHSVNEYQAAIAILYRQKMFGAAFSLLRVLAEAQIKGMWLLRCAGDGELQQFLEGKLKKTFQDFIDDVEQASPSLEGTLSMFKKAFWKTLNGFTHTGIEQLSRRQVYSKSTSKYSEHDLKTLLSTAQVLGAMSYSEIYNLGGRRDLLEQLTERMAEQ